MATSDMINLTSVKRDPTFMDGLSPAGRLIRRCIQCGTCSASCPTVYGMDYTPRELWRLVNLGLVEEVLDSRTFWLCTVCKSCQVRCPRGIGITDAMVALKEWAMREGIRVPERLVALGETVTGF